MLIIQIPNKFIHLRSLNCYLSPNLFISHIFFSFFLFCSDLFKSFFFCFLLLVFVRAKETEKAAGFFFWVFGFACGSFGFLGARLFWKGYRFGRLNSLITISIFIAHISWLFQSLLIWGSTWSLGFEFFLLRFSITSLNCISISTFKLIFLLLLILLPSFWLVRRCLVT